LERDKLPRANPGTRASMPCGGGEDHLRRLGFPIEKKEKQSRHQKTVKKDLQPQVKELESFFKKRGEKLNPGKREARKHKERGKKFFPIKKGNKNYVVRARVGDGGSKKTAYVPR